MSDLDFESIAVREDCDPMTQDPANRKGHVFREYRAARRHGEALISPSLDQVPNLLRENLALQQTHDALIDLRHNARKLLLEDALRYTSSYRNVDWFDLPTAHSQPILMAGHQPAIFHAGVWFKNFALSHLAASHAAVAINLVIDNDVASGSSIRVPTLDEASGRAVYRSVPYDRAGGGVPYEQTTIEDRDLFDSFDRRVCEAVAPLESNPCITQLWKHARIAVDRCGIAGCALAQARHGLEGELGLRTLELPLGVICRTSAFSEFVLMILNELPRFRQCYNDAARCYRRAHGIRSSSHPVPNLAQEDEWFEAPLWIYGNDSPKRRAAWARLSNDELILSDRAGREVRLDIRFPKLAAEKLSSRIGPNFKLRPRALLTTMYARLVLSDLFMHGIGGGKYDQLGDMIMESFFMIEPPKFMVISATVMLPGPERVSPALRTEQLQRMIRDTVYCPEVFADRFALDPDLLNRKREMLAAIPERGNRRDWHRQVEDLNRSLAKPLEEFRQELRSELASMRLDAASHAVFTSREHPFCVFPLEHLTSTYQRLLE